jgi:uncharacterized membrane protein
MTGDRVRRFVPTRAELTASGDLVVVIVVAAIAALLALIIDNGALPRMLLAAPLVLALPGYAVVAAAFPGSALGTPERVTCSLGTSVALAALGGFVLNWLPWGLQTATWVSLLAGIAIVASIVAVLTRRTERHRAARVAPRRWLAAWPGPAQSVLLGLAVAIVVGAIGLARQGALEQHRAGFTQLWALPTGGTPQQVHLGIQCEEPAPVTYLLRVEVGGAVLHEWAPLELQPGERWETAGVVLPPAQEPGSMPVQAVLYRLDAPELAYRRVTEWQ